MGFCASIELGLRLLVCLRFVFSALCASSRYVLLLASGLHQNALGFRVCVRDTVVCDFYICLP